MNHFLKTNIYISFGPYCNMSMCWGGEKCSRVLQWIPLNLNLDHLIIMRVCVIVIIIGYSVVVFYNGFL